MTFPKARLVVSAILFLAWLGFLFGLVLETNKTVISKPQFQIAQAVLVVAVRDDGGRPDPMVTVQEVLASDDKAQQLAGRKMRLIDLLGCKKEHGYVGAGDYVIPLMRRGAAWQIAPIPTPGYKRPHPSHGTLELHSAGPDPECVLERLLDYARQKPREADDLLEPLMLHIATCYLGRAFFGADFVWQREIVMPRGTLPRRLPIADALALQKELEECKAKVSVNVEEVRIYSWTPEVRGQVDEILAAKGQ